MPIKVPFLVWCVDDGRKFTIHAGSPRAAMRKFVAEYGPPPGITFKVKERGTSSEWEGFKTTSSGIRSVKVDE